MPAADDEARVLQLDELALELAPLKVRDRRRIQIIGEVISRSHLLDEH